MTVFSGKAVEVGVSMYVLSISSLSEVEMVLGKIISQKLLLTNMYSFLNVFDFLLIQILASNFLWFRFFFDIILSKSINSFATQKTIVSNTYFTSCSVLTISQYSEKISFLE